MFTFLSESTHYYKNVSEKILQFEQNAIILRICKNVENCRHFGTSFA